MLRTISKYTVGTNVSDYPENSLIEISRKETYDFLEIQRNKK